MFENIVLRRSENGLPVSAGQIAEALLYYQNVNLVIDHGTLGTLVKQLGINRFISLLKHPDLKAVHCEESLATHSQNFGNFNVHTYVTLKFSGHETVGNLKTRAERLQYLFTREGLSRREAGRYAEQFESRVPARKFSGDHFQKGGIVAAAKQDLLDAEFTREALRLAVTSMVGGYPIGTDLKFDVIDSDIGFHVFTNIDIEGINRRRAACAPPHDPISVPLLMSHILEARADLALASFYGGDFSTSDMTSTILRVRHAELLRRTHLNVDARDDFSEVVLPDCPSLREVIDSGERSFDDFLLLLDKAKRFKEWLKSVNPDKNLIRTYLRDVTAEDWIQSIPAKTLRYLFTTGLDATNPLLGIAATLVDTFVVEKLVRGWRPNHFIDARLTPFVNKP